MSSVMGAASRANVVPLPELGTTDLVGSMPVVEAAQVCIRPSIARFLALEPAVRAGFDPDTIHDMRVAGRRIRTALKLFRGSFPAGAEEARSEIRWVASLLGDVRDLDVQRMSLAPVLEELPPEERVIVHAVDDVLAARRAEAHARLIEALDSPRYHALRGRIVELARAQAEIADEAPRSIADVAPVMVRKPYRKLRRAGNRLGAESSSAALHALRLKTKRSRYALEFVAPLYDDPAEEVISRLVRLQDLLGDLHDAEVAAQRWHDFAVINRDALPDGAPFTLGRLAERSAAEARSLRRRFPRTFRSIRGRRWKDLKRAMEAKAAP